jgi:hypothetical protein
MVQWLLSLILSGHSLSQLYDQDILAVKIDFEETGFNQINVQFSANFCCGTAEQQMLP